MYVLILCVVFLFFCFKSWWLCLLLQFLFWNKGFIFFFPFLNEREIVFARLCHAHLIKSWCLGYILWYQYQSPCFRFFWTEALYCLWIECHSFRRLVRILSLWRTALYSSPVFISSQYLRWDFHCISQLTCIFE